MSIKGKISNGADANLQISFDVGHSSIGWAVLEKTGAQASDINILGCGSVVFRADDCLASSRRAYRRQRRHIRSTRQRIARMKILLQHLGVLTAKELDKPGCAWPWKLAAQILQNGKLLTWPELWDVLRWYAHNRGYDGNERWSKIADAETESADVDDAALDKILNDTSATEDQKNDAKKVIEAKNLMRRHNVKTMAETFCKELGVDPLGSEKSSMKRFKGLNAAFPRKNVETEVHRILRAHFGKLKSVDEKFERALIGKDNRDKTAWQACECPALKLPKRYEGGLLFGQLVPRFDNRIISTCPISEQKVPSRNCPEFLNFRWAMLLANMKVCRPGERELTPLTVSERKAIDSIMRERGAMTESELKKVVRDATKSVRDKLDQMFMEELDAKKALILDPVQELVCSDKFAPFWKHLPERLQKRLRGQWRRNKVFTLAQIRRQLESLGDASAFDAELQTQLDTHNTKAKKKDKQVTREELLQKHFPSRPLKLDGRAAFARHLLKQAYEDVLAGKQHPKEEGGCLFITEEIRQKQLDRAIADQTNNHLVRHRLIILERVLGDIVKEYAEGKKERIGKITIEVNRDLREMSGMSAKAKDREMRDKLGNIRAVEKYVLDRLPEKYHGHVNGNFLRKARVADDLDWRCPYTGEMIQPIHFITGVLELDHIIPYALRPSNSLDSLAATFSVVNKMKRKRTAMQFMREMGGQPVCFVDEKGRDERVEGMSNLSLMHFKDFKSFVEKLKIRGNWEHNQDKERRLRRKRLFEIESYEEKEFLPRDLTQTSQLVRLGAQVLRKNLPHLTTGDVTSLPGSVTGTVRKNWKLEGCLNLANPQVMEESLDENGRKVSRAKTKTEIRAITHLHHALDACVLGIAAIYFKNQKLGAASLWELLIKRKYNEQEKSVLQTLGIFQFDQEGKTQLKKLPDEIRDQICQRLAEKRVVQHIPARMDGMPVDLNMWRLHGWSENGKAILEKHSRDVSGKRKLDKPKAGADNKVRLIGWSPENGNGKLKALKAVLITNTNFGVALDPEPKIIPFHKVHSQIFKGVQEEKSLIERNGGKMPRILRNGQIIKVANGRFNGTWKITSIKNKTDGINVNLGRPDTVRTEDEVTDPETGKKKKVVRPDCKHEVSLASLLKGGLSFGKTPFTGIVSCPTTSSA